MPRVLVLVLYTVDAVMFEDAVNAVDAVMYEDAINAVDAVM